MKKFFGDKNTKSNVYKRGNATPSYFITPCLKIDRSTTFIICSMLKVIIYAPIKKFSMNSFAFYQSLISEPISDHLESI